MKNFGIGRPGTERLMLSYVESTGLKSDYADFVSCKQATIKATMCFEISGYANYVPIPKQMRCTPYQGFGEPKITGPRWENGSDNVWNQEDEAVPADNTGRFSLPATELRAKPRCALKSRDTKITVPSPPRLVTSGE